MLSNKSLCVSYKIKLTEKEKTKIFFYISFHFPLFLSMKFWHCIQNKGK